MIVSSRVLSTLLLAAGAAWAACDSTLPEDPNPMAARVEVVPTVANLEPGESSQFTARVFDDSSNLLNKAVTWTSADPGVASINSSGLAEALAEGTSLVQARVDGRTGSATVNVAEPSGAAVSSVDVAPAAPSLVVGQSVTLAATPRDAGGAALTGRTVAWATGNASVASVNGAGVVTGIGAGATEVTATVEGVEGSASVTVTQPQSANGVVDIDLARTFQTMVGWEGTAQMGQVECGPGYEGWRDELADRLVDELGINRVRMHVRSGHESDYDWFAQYLADPTDASYRQHRYRAVNDNGNPNATDASGYIFTELDHTIATVVDPLRQAMQARGEKLYVNLNFVDFGQGEPNRLHRDNPEEYAELVVAAFWHIQQRHGWVPDALEVVLEPDNSNSGWTPQQVAAALAAVGPRLEAAGFTPDFIAPATTPMTNAVPWTNAIARNAQAMQYLDVLSYHRYGQESVQEAANIAALAQSLGLETAMLEKIGAGIDQLWTDVTIANNSAWQQFGLGYCGTGDGSYYRILNGQLSLRDLNRPFLQIFPFVRRDAVRYGTTVRDPSLRAMAFRNFDGRWAVIVQTQGPKTFTVGHLPPGTYEVSYTAANPGGATAASLGTVTVVGGEVVTLEMPTAGVVTVYGG